MPETKTQKKYLKNIEKNNLTTHVWEGPVGCGKTYGMVKSIYEECIRDRILDEGNHIYALCGPIFTTTVRNVRDAFYDIGDEYGLKTTFRKDDTGHYYHIPLPVDAKIYVFSGGKEGSDRGPRGANISKAWVDETTEMNRSFIDMIMTRLRAHPHPKISFFMNATDPNHWFYTDYLDSFDDEKTVYYESTFTENINLPQSYIDFVLNNLDPASFQYKRLVENQRMPASGLCIPILERHKQHIPSLPLSGYVGYDPGIESCTAGVLVVHNDRKFHVAAEYYHDRDKYGVLSDEQHLYNMSTKWHFQQIYTDPTATATPFRAVANKLGYNASAGEMDVKAGIALLNHALYMGILTIDRTNCPLLLRQLSGYHWGDNGMPVKREDHLPDALRYVVSKVIPIYNSFVAGIIKRG